MMNKRTVRASLLPTRLLYDLPCRKIPPFESRSKEAREAITLFEQAYLLYEIKTLLPFIDKLPLRHGWEGLYCIP